MTSSRTVTIISSSAVRINSCLGQWQLWRHLGLETNFFFCPLNPRLLAISGNYDCDCQQLSLCVMIFVKWRLKVIGVGIFGIAILLLSGLQNVELWLLWHAGSGTTGNYKQLSGLLLLWQLCQAVITISLLGMVMISRLLLIWLDKWLVISSCQVWLFLSSSSFLCEVSSSHQYWCFNCLQSFQCLPQCLLVYLQVFHHGS